MGLRIRFQGENIGQQFATKMRARAFGVSRAARRTMEEAGTRIKTAGDQDIRQAGKFGRRWTDSFKTPIIGQGTRLILSVLSTIPYFSIHEYGGIIRGKPLLWIPLPWNRQKVRARDYKGSLFRVDRRGKNPLLWNKAEGAQYVGVSQVRLRKRFHIRAIIKRVSRTIPALYRKYFRLENKRR